MPAATSLSPRTAIRATARLDEPLSFIPHMRPQVWGGRRLAELLGKELPPRQPIGESWELSAHAGHQSVVAAGPWGDRTLKSLWTEHRIDLTGNGFEQDQFPWLIKWLDCRAKLSVQVHPDDQLARRLLGEPNGKTESWFVLDAAPTARIYAGFKAGITRQDVMTHLTRGTIASCLHSFRPQPGDCLHIPAGTVHALGGGVVVAEVQQSSDATFRLFDWNRHASGIARPLQIPEALECLDFSRGPVEPIRPALREANEHFTRHRLIHCPHFHLDRVDIFREWVATNRGLSVIMVVGGEGNLRASSRSENHCLARGNTMLIPAGTTEITLRAAPGEPLSLLWIRLPMNGD